MAKAVKETRTLRAHVKLLHDVIMRQAGSLQKALLEGVMNSVDANASNCNITADAQKIVIEDDGTGIAKRKHIEDFFETFGQPHEASERKTYGTFRMGRGQMFAFGHNTWRTGPFEMQVDIKDRGLEYELTTHPVHHEGCRIEMRLYKPLLPGQLLDLRNELAHLVKYAPMETTFNGEKLNRDPADEKWDFVLPEAYIRLRQSGSLVVYNLGVHTLDLAAHRIGTGGEVVSRQQLKVNFARTDIHDDCPVWQEVRKFVGRKATDRNTRSESLDDAGRLRLARQVLSGEVPLGKLRLFTAVTGRHYSADQAYWYARSVFTHAPDGDRAGDKVHRSRLAFVLADETLERFGFEGDLAGFAGWLRKKIGTTVQPVVKPLIELAGVLADDHEVIPDEEHTPLERAWLSLADSGQWTLVDEILHAIHGRDDEDTSLDWRERWQYRKLHSARRSETHRRLLLGHSKFSDGWTDGRTYIALSRGLLKRLKMDISGFTELGRVVLHELTHKEQTTQKHDHTQEFYEEYHDNSRHLGAFVETCLGKMPQALRNAGRKLTRKHAAVLDKVAVAGRAAASYHGAASSVRAAEVRRRIEARKAARRVKSAGG